MVRLVTRWSLAAVLLVMVGVSPSAAGTLTIDNTDRHSEDIRVISIGDVPLTTICGRSEAFACIDLTSAILDRGNGAILTFRSDSNSLGAFANGMDPLVVGTPQTTTANPEPGTLLLLGSGLLLFAKAVRNRLK